MPSKITYAILYFITPLLAIILAVLTLGSFESFVPTLIGIVLVILVPIIVNLWYGSKLGVPTLHKWLAAIFSPVGFLYLMGHDLNTMSAGMIITQTIKLYKKNWQLFVKYAVLLLIPSLVVSLLAMYMFPELNQKDVNIPFSSTLVLYLVIAFVASISSFWFSVSFIRAIISCYREEGVPGLKKGLMGSARLIIPGILISLLVGLIVLGGTLLLIIPGILFSLWYAFAFYAVIADGTAVTDSLGVSKALVKNRWWVVLWRLAFPGLVFGVIISVANWIAVLPLGFLPETTTTIALASVVASAVTMLFIPLTTTAPSILYVELKKSPTKADPLPKTPAPSELPQV